MEYAQVLGERERERERVNRRTTKATRSRRPPVAVGTTRDGEQKKISEPGGYDQQEERSKRGVPCSVNVGTIILSRCSWYTSRTNNMIHVQASECRSSVSYNYQYLG